MPRSIEAIDLDGQTCLLGTMVDITERKRAEEALEAERALLAQRVEERTVALSVANAELARALRLKDEFLASMSHELRTPLNAIIGFTGTLLMKMPGPLTADQERQLTIVRSNARHLLSLINDILDLAKIESGKIELSLEPLVCQAAITEVVTSLRPLAEAKGLALTATCPSEPIVIQSDRRALSQILINLVNNAIKFTDAGCVTIALERTFSDGARRTAIRVSDSGIGIRAEDQARLFQEFGRVDSAEVRAREGTGLGLRLSWKLAELLGGRIEVESAYDQGSSFTLVLPARAKQK